MEKKEVILWITVWLGLSALGAIWLSSSERDKLQRQFEADSRIAHRLLTQRTVQHDTILATLAAGASTDDVQCAAGLRNQITTMYPQVTAVLCDTMQQAWADVPSTAASCFNNGRYWLTLDGTHKRWALQVDILKMIPRSEWPAASMQIELLNEQQSVMLQESASVTGVWNFHFAKPLASDSQPFMLVTRQHIGWAGLPWNSIMAWIVATGVALAIGAAWRWQWMGRHRAERLLRLRKMERLNTLGELAAGMAHELNQPLTAILANCQAAKRCSTQNDPISTRRATRSCMPWHRPSAQRKSSLACAMPSASRTSQAAYARSRSTMRSTTCCICWRRNSSCARPRWCNRHACRPPWSAPIRWNSNRSCTTC